MTCRVYEEQLSSYLDGELPMMRAARLEAHLKTCEHCRTELDALGGIAHQLRAVSNFVEVSHDFDNRVLRAVGYFRVTGWQRPVRSYLRPLVYIMLTLLATLGMVWHYFTRPFDAPPGWQPQPAPAVVAPAAVPTPPSVMPEREQERTQ